MLAKDIHVYALFLEIEYSADDEREREKEREHVENKRRSSIFPRELSRIRDRRNYNYIISSTLDLSFAIPFLLLLFLEKNVGNFSKKGKRRENSRLGTRS